MCGSDKLECHDHLAAKSTGGPDGRRQDIASAGHRFRRRPRSFLSAATVTIPISAIVVAPAPPFPAVAVVSIVSFTYVSDDSASGATRGGSHCGTFPRAARQPTDNCATGCTDTSTLFRLAARGQRQANENAGNDLFHVCPFDPSPLQPTVDRRPSTVETNQGGTYDHRKLRGNYAEPSP